MAKADYALNEFREVPCNCHPETCACGGYELVPPTKKDVEEKMYTREEVRAIIHSYAKYVWYIDNNDTNEWFEQNVK